MHQIKQPEWVALRRQMMPRVEHVQARSTALLVVDLQRCFVDPGSPVTVPTAIEIVPLVNQIAHALRARGGQVIWIRHTVSDDEPFAAPAWFAGPEGGYVSATREYLLAGAPGHELHAGFTPAESDWVIDKHRFSAFPENSSDLHKRLQGRGIDTVILAGALTNCCCESSARDALMLDYRVLFSCDATSALTDEEHNASLLNLALTFVDVRPTREILDLIDRSS